MKKAKYRAVVVGCGNMGALFERDRHRPKPATHAGAIERNPKTQLVGLVDPNAKTLAAAGKLFPRAARYFELGACVKREQPDIVVIATHAPSHYALAKEIISAGVPIIICEKPLAPTIAEARQIERLVRKSGTTFILNHQRRFFEGFKMAQASIEHGELGRIQQVTCYYSNGLYANGSHSIDAALYLLQDDVVQVVGRRNAHNATHPASDVNLDALLLTKRGTTIALQSLDQDSYVINSITILGERGSISIEEFGFAITYRSVEPSRFAKLNQLALRGSRRCRKIESATAGALAHAIAVFEQREAPRSSATTGRTLVEVLALLSHDARRSDWRY